MPLKHQAADNQTVFFGGSEFGVASGASQWFGYVQNSSFDEDEGRRATRFVGGTNRNVDVYLEGARNFRGTTETMIQDGKFFVYGFGGSLFDDKSGSPGATVHVVSELGTTTQPPTFTVEDVQASSTNEGISRVANGCVTDTWTIEGTEGEDLKSTYEYPIKSIVNGSAAATAITAATDVPFRFDHVRLRISGTELDGFLEELKGFTWSVNQNLGTHHYLDGTVLNASGTNERTIAHPTRGARDYEFEITMDMAAGTGGDLYNLYRSGSPMNIDLFVFRTSGTDMMNIHMSGARMMAADQPDTTFEGEMEQTITWQPQSCEVRVTDSTFDYPTPNVF